MRIIKLAVIFVIKIVHDITSNIMALWTWSGKTIFTYYHQFLSLSWKLSKLLTGQQFVLRSIPLVLHRWLLLKWQITPFQKLWLAHNHSHFSRRETEGYISLILLKYSFLLPSTFSNQCIAMLGDMTINISLFAVASSINHPKMPHFDAQFYLF